MTTIQSRAISSPRSQHPPNGRRLLAVYRAQLSSLIELERELVDLGHLKPEERRVLSREERRAGLGDVNGR